MFHLYAFTAVEPFNQPPVDAAVPPTGGWLGGRMALAVVDDALSSATCGIVTCRWTDGWMGLLMEEILHQVRLIVFFFVFAGFHRCQVVGWDSFHQQDGFTNNI